MSIKNGIPLLALCLSLQLGAQHNISGKLSPAADFKWLIGYKLNPSSQSYIADTEIKNGDFTLKIPANSPTGVYRMVYAVPQEEFYFDLIYNGKEDIKLSFDLEKGLDFTASGENLVFQNYFKEINALESQIEKLYDHDVIDPQTEADLFKKLQNVQADYVSRSKNLLSAHFIKANSPYIPTAYEMEHAPYRHHKMEHYFDALDFNDPVLQGSEFLSDKLADYVFHLFASPPRNRGEMEHEMQLKVRTAAMALKNVELPYQSRLMEDLWNRAVQYNFDATADNIYENYLRDLAQETQNIKLIDKIETYNRLRLGAVAPEVTWEEDGNTKNLSELSNYKYYVLVFWSSTCSHCLNELPKLQQGLKGATDAKVLAIGLEDGQDNWKKESTKLPDFIHGISLGKWESRYVDLYKVQHTPTYFILDSEKRIVAKPEHVGEVLDFLKN
ncbi:MAG TPA: TlpA disulfide reductase family protein [Arenibacter sp.]|nr:TlpA disulfide reductase family protein [Arenibacter sp.]